MTNRNDEVWQEFLIKIRDRYESLVDDDYSDGERKERTPIEKFMYLGLLSIFGDDYLKVKIVDQYKIGKYKVDFLVKNPWSNIVVECDGHDWHEKTKEQACRDKAKDRFLQTNGYRVFRFTGSEIYKDPFRCAEEIETAIYNDSRIKIKSESSKVAA